MEIVLKSREELGLTATTSTAETGIAKDLFKGLSYILNNRKGVRPSVTFIDEKTNKSQTVTVEEDLIEPVRSGKITINHLLGFTVIRANNDGKVDDTEVETLDAVRYNELAGY